MFRNRYIQRLQVKEKSSSRVLIRTGRNPNILWNNPHLISSQLNVNDSNRIPNSVQFTHKLMCVYAKRTVIVYSHNETCHLKTQHTVHFKNLFSGNFQLHVDHTSLRNYFFKVGGGLYIPVK